MIRWLQLKSLYLQRRHPRSKATWLSRLLHSKMVVWNIHTASRGVAIGMFWAFAPIPLQMLPAALFCWLIRGNLPVAILCVWISNPLTIPPLLLLEYRIGEIILQGFLELPVADIVISNIYSVFSGGLRRILVGSLFLSCLMMVGGYVTIIVAFKLSSRHRHHSMATARKDKPSATTASPRKEDCATK